MSALYTLFLCPPLVAFTSPTPALASIVPAPIVQDDAEPEQPAPVPQVDQIAIPAPPAVVDFDAEVLAHIQGIIKALTDAQAAEYESDLAKVTALGAAWADLGLAYEANTMWSRALPCYDMAIAFLPEKPEWMYRKGAALTATGDLNGALTALENAAGRLLNTTVVQARLGDVALMLGRFDLAEAAWRQAIASEANFEREVKFPECRVGLAQVLIEIESYEDAEALLREALALNPGYRHAHHLLGLVLNEIGDEDEARFALLRGRNAFPAFPPDPHQPRLAAHAASYQRRMMGIENAMGSGNMQGAIEQIEAVLLANPKDHFALNMKARVMMMQGQHAAAYQTLIEAEAIDPNHYSTLVEIAITCLNLLQAAQPEQAGQLLNEAQARSERAIELAPLVGRPWYVRGLVESFRANGIQDQKEMQKAMQTALQLMQRAHALGCEEQQMYQSMAQVFAQLGQLSEMVRYAEAGTNSQPENAAAWAFRAKAHLTLAQMDPTTAAVQLVKAELSVKHAVEVSRGDPNISQFAVAMTNAIAELKKP
jgi:tetratricopeptide (TPR) repeat protein